MAQITITPESLRGRATEVRGLKTNHDDTMAKLDKLIHSLNSEFKGEAHDALVSKFESMKPQFNEFSNMLEGYAKLMDQAANNIEEADKTTGNTIRKSFT